LFCEDPVTTQSDEFFGIFDHFITCFQEAKMDNENARKKREEEEKIAKQHQEVLYLLFFTRLLIAKQHQEVLYLLFLLAY
jgi:hypothetical protein